MPACPPHKPPLFLLLVALLLAVSGCSPQDATPPTSEADQPAQDALDRGLSAHGGLETWRSYGTLEYDMPQGNDQHEHHLIDLQARHALMTGDGYTIGYDGNEVWVAPGLDAFSGNPRFYNGLHFYFFSIPFVLADPGTRREPLGQKTVAGRVYDVVKVSFDPGTGESSHDAYFAHFDAETHRLGLVLYASTYNSQAPSENYNAQVYEEWQEVGGLILPQKITWHPWDEEQETLGEPRSEMRFTNVRLAPERPEGTRFTRPAEAEVANHPEATSG